MASRQVGITLDEEVIELLDQYAKELHLSRSALIGFMISQIDQVVRVTVPKLKEMEAAPSGDD